MKSAHDALTERAGGEKLDNKWNSARAAAYPSDLNKFIAASLSRLVVSRQEVSVPLPVVRQRQGIGVHSFESDRQTTNTDRAAAYESWKRYVTNAPPTAQPHEPLRSPTSADLPPR